MKNVLIFTDLFLHFMKTYFNQKNSLSKTVNFFHIKWKINVDDIEKYFSKKKSRIEKKKAPNSSKKWTKVNKEVQTDHHLSESEANDSRMQCNENKKVPGKKLSLPELEKKISAKSVSTFKINFWSFCELYSFVWKILLLEMDFS